MPGKFHTIALLPLGCIFLAAAAAHADVFNLGSGLTSLQFVTVGDAGNAADTAVMTLDGTTGYGSVGSAYNMGMYDVTAAQYCAMLNAVAGTSDPYGLYNVNMDTAVSSYGCNIKRTLNEGVYSYSVAAEWANRPVNYVSWGDAVRFCNWLQNGQPAGAEDLTTTENGAYYSNGATTDATLLAVTRKAEAKYFLPSENEWYKAAFYDPNKPDGAGYWAYPTLSDAVPSNALSATGANNADFYSGGYTIGSPYYRTEVGAFASSPGPYGTFDQGGNVNEWVETKVIVGASSYRGLRGGSYSNSANLLASTARNGTVPTGDGPGIGFRIASILQAETYSWQGGDDDTMTAWGVAANWTLGSVPDGPGVNVQFGTQPAASSIVDMVSVGRTVGNITFAETTGTLIQSTYGHALVLDNRGEVSTLDVSGDHYISAR